VFGEALSYGAYEIVEPTPMSGFGQVAPTLPAVQPTVVPAPVTTLVAPMRPFAPRLVLPVRIPPQLVQLIATKVQMLAPGILPMTRLGPQIVFEQQEGLWVAPPGASVLMGTMMYTPDPGATEGQETGKATFVLGQLSGNAWTTVQSKNALGFASLIDKASVTTGTFNLVFTTSPDIVALLAGGDTATHALLTEEPQTIIAAARDQIRGKAVPSVEEKEKPNWFVPVLIGAGVLVVGAFVFAGRKAKANPKRRRRIGPRYAKLCVCEKVAVNPARRRGLRP